MRADIYLNKRFTVVGNASRIYVNFDLPIQEAQFKNGKI